MTEKNKTHVVVIGAGPGGYSAAFLAADLGLQVTLIDPEPNPGGVCLYRGCIPSKSLLHVAKVITEADEAEILGVKFAKPKINLDQIRSWKENVVQKLTVGLGLLTKQRKIHYIQGKAQFLNSNTIKVIKREGEKKLSFEYAILAAGAYSAQLPNMSLKSDRIWDSSAALELSSVPKSMLVVGGGYIGLELGTVYATLGTRVSVVEMLPGLLPGADPDLVSVLLKRAEKLFESIMVNTVISDMKEKSDTIEVFLEGENALLKEMSYEIVLVSVGRKPNSSGMGLENTKVEIDYKGFVKVNEQLQTTDPAIYAIGDIVGGPMLAHKASHEGKMAARAIAGKNMTFEPLAIPAVEFTDPEIAWCGLTEIRARKENRKIRVVRFPWAASGRALTMGRDDGMTKLIIDSVTERILGVGIVGPGAGELISEGALAVEMAALASDIGSTIHPHPTLSETLMEAAQIFYGQSTHVYRPKNKRGAS